MREGNTPERTGFRPNPNETVPPATAEDAFGDLLRYMASQQTREGIIDQLREVDPSKVVASVQGITTGPPLTGLELMLGMTIEYCARERLLRSPIQAAGLIEAVRQDVLDGEVL
jgi:hypothetical protein